MEKCARINPRQGSRPGTQILPTPLPAMWRGADTTWIRSHAGSWQTLPWRNDMVLHTAGNTIRLAKLGHRLEPRATALCDWRTLQPNPKAQSWRVLCSANLVPSR